MVETSGTVTLHNGNNGNWRLFFDTAIEKILSAVIPSCNADVSFVSNCGALVMQLLPSR